MKCKFLLCQYTNDISVNFSSTINRICLHLSFRATTSEKKKLIVILSRYLIILMFLVLQSYILGNQFLIQPNRVTIFHQAVDPLLPELPLRELLPRSLLLSLFRSSLSPFTANLLGFSSVLWPFSEFSSFFTFFSFAAVVTR